MIYNFDDFPHFLEKKVKLFHYFKDYLENNRSCVSEIPTLLITSEDEEENSWGNPFLDSSKSRKRGKQAYVSHWMKTDQAIFFKMNNKVVQVVFKSGACLMIDPLGKYIEYINVKGEKNCFNPEDLERIKDEEIASRVKYVQIQLNEIWKMKKIDEY